jgi:hypothetical protein
MSQNGEDNRSSGDSCRGSSRVTGGCEAEARWFWCSRGPIASVERCDNGHKKASHGAELLDAWGIAEMGWRECAGWCEMDSETATWVQSRREASDDAKSSSQCARHCSVLFIVYGEGAASGCDEEGGKRRWKEGAMAEGCRRRLPRSVLSRSAGRRVGELARVEMRSAPALWCRWVCSVFGERLQGARRASWCGVVWCGAWCLVWSQTQGLAVLGVSVA